MNKNDFSKFSHDGNCDQSPSNPHFSFTENAKVLDKSQWQIQSNLKFSPPSKSQTEFKNKSGCLKFISSTFEKGSLSYGIAIWITLSFATILITPFYISAFGCLAGAATIFIGGCLNYQGCWLIYKASVETGITDYAKLGENILGPALLKIFYWTLTIDYLSSFILNGMVSWSLFEFFMLSFGFMDENWVLDKNKLVFKEYEPGLFLIRGVFFACLFCALIPFFLKKTLASFQVIFGLSLAIVGSLTVWILVEGPFFKNYFQSENQLSVELLIKKPSLRWISLSFSVMYFFYVQPYILTVQNQIAAPCYQRLKNLAGLAILIQGILFGGFGIFVYTCFGDKFTPYIMITRIPYKDKNVASELAFKIFVALFFGINALLNSILNVSIREFLMGRSRMREGKLKFALFSVLPLGICFGFDVAMPWLADIVGVLGLVVCNYNGFIVPILMDIEIEKRKGKFGCVGVGKVLMIFVYLILGIVGFCLKIFRIE